MVVGTDVIFVHTLADIVDPLIGTVEKEDRGLISLCIDIHLIHDDTVRNTFRDERASPVGTAVSEGKTSDLFDPRFVVEEGIVQRFGTEMFSKKDRERFLRQVAGVVAADFESDIRFECRFALFEIFDRRFAHPVLFVVGNDTDLFVVEPGGIDTDRDHRQRDVLVDQIGVHRHGAGEFPLFDGDRPYDGGFIELEGFGVTTRGGCRCRSVKGKVDGGFLFVAQRDRHGSFIKSGRFGKVRFFGPLGFGMCRCVHFAGSRHHEPYLLMIETERDVGGEFRIDQFVDQCAVSVAKKQYAPLLTQFEIGMQCFALEVEKRFLSGSQSIAPFAASSSFSRTFDFKGERAGDFDAVCSGGVVFSSL